MNEELIMALAAEYHQQCGEAVEIDIIRAEAMREALARFFDCRSTLCVVADEIPKDDLSYEPLNLTLYHDASDAVANGEAEAGEVFAIFELVPTRRRFAAVVNHFDGDHPWGYDWEAFDTEDEAREWLSMATEEVE